MAAGKCTDSRGSSKNDSDDDESRSRCDDDEPRSRSKSNEKSEAQAPKSNTDATKPATDAPRSDSTCDAEENSQGNRCPTEEQSLESKWNNVFKRRLSEAMQRTEARKLQKHRPLAVSESDETYNPTSDDATISPRQPIRLKPCRERHDEAWIIAGDDALMPNFLNDLMETARTDTNWHVQAVRLPTELVVHTGVAVFQLLFAIDAGMIPMSESMRVHCAISECNLKYWPKTSKLVHKQRIDNINFSMRAFSVDGQSTSAMEKKRNGNRSGQFLLRSSLGSFVMMGCGVFGDIDADTYKRRLTWLGKRAMTDENLAEELVFANLYSPERAPNGIRLQNSSGIKMLVNHIAAVSG